MRRHGLNTHSSAMPFGPFKVACMTGDSNQILAICLQYISKNGSEATHLEARPGGMSSATDVIDDMEQPTWAHTASYVRAGAGAAMSSRKGECPTLPCNLAANRQACPGCNAGTPFASQPCRPHLTVFLNACVCSQEGQCL